ncbi:MAG: methyltransferase domain-containing protein [Proteobacteria bacterium]|nr:methyltransferase domain-containing protein [Pseudomonadota bacterium]MBU4009700.1 methyltransferase domain-containing protein [Pseudomonadota bacterium]MBU4037531.1 methyltransferase domain-containing protein [Pseudomonadota bacterium]
MKSSIVKAYEANEFNQVLDEILHPGGLELTKKTAESAGIQNGDLVLDIASGRGSSACFISDVFDCRVIGTDLSLESSSLARKKAQKLPLSNKAEFCLADAESLPFADSVFDAVITECAFSLFPDKTTVAREIIRVLKPGGKFSMSDVILNHPLISDLKDEVLFNCCFTGALTKDGYIEVFSKAGLEYDLFEDHSIELKKIALRLISGYGSLNDFWKQFAGRSISCCSTVKNGTDPQIEWKRLFAESKPGYAVFSFRKPL